MEEKKPAPVGEKAASEKPPAGKHGPAAKHAPGHKKEEKPAAEPPPRSPVEQWLDAYLEATMGAATARKFGGTMEVTDYIPQIRVELQRKALPIWGRPLAALGGLLLGLALGAVSWLWLPPTSVAGAAGLLVALLLVVFSLARLLRPPIMRVKMDALINRLQWWNAHGTMKEITFIGCRAIELVEQRLPRGYRWRIWIEPRWGASVRVATGDPGPRQEALLNTVELVRSLVKVSHLPVRVKLWRLAREPLKLSEVPAAKPAGKEPD